MVPKIGTKIEHRGPGFPGTRGPELVPEFGTKMVPKVIPAGWFSWSAWNGFPGFRGARFPLLVGVFSYSLLSRFLDSFPGLRGLVSRSCSRSFSGSWLIFWYVHLLSVVWICESAVFYCTFVVYFYLLEHACQPPAR